MYPPSSPARKLVYYRLPMLLLQKKVLHIFVSISHRLSHKVRGDKNWEQEFLTGSDVRILRLTAVKGSRLPQLWSLARDWIGLFEMFDSLPVCWEFMLSAVWSSCGVHESFNCEPAFLLVSAISGPASWKSVRLSCWSFCWFFFGSNTSVVMSTESTSSCKSILMSQ